MQSTFEDAVFGHACHAKTLIDAGLQLADGRGSPCAQLAAVEQLLLRLRDRMNAIEIAVIDRKRRDWPRRRTAPREGDGPGDGPCRCSCGESFP